MKFVILTEKEFEKYEGTFPNSYFYQTTNWAHLKENNAWKAHYTAIMEKDKVVGIGMLLEKKLFLNKSLFYLPRGFLTDYKNTKYLKFYTESLKEYVKNNNGIFFKIDPLIWYKERDNTANIVEGGIDNENIVNDLKKMGYIHKGFTKGYTDEYQARWSYALNIKDKTFEEIFSKMHERAKRSIKKYQKYPLISKFLTSKNIDDFFELTEHTCKRQKQSNRTKKYYQKVYDAFSKNEDVKILVIYLNKKEYLDKFDEKDPSYSLVLEDKREEIPLAGGLFICHAKTVNYVYGCAYQDYMKIMAQYKVQCDMIKYAIENKYETYDFGGITGNFDPESHAYGIYGFKRGFAGYVIEYIGEFDYPVNKFYYFLYKILYRGYELMKKIRQKKIKE